MARLTWPGDDEWMVLTLEAMRTTTVGDDDANRDDVLSRPEPAPPDDGGTYAVPITALGQPIED